MKAAVVSSFGTAPRYEDFPSPAPGGADEIVVDVLAAGLHPRVRSQADGSHYTSTGELPLVPGIDGVGRDPDGKLRYFILPDTTMGAMAEQTVVDTRRSVVLPGGTNPVTVAAAMNPAMSSWVGLRQRVAFQPGMNVLILGATGNAGQLAVQVAKLLGAGQIVAAGRDAGKLPGLTALGATETVVLDGSPDAAADSGTPAGMPTSSSTTCGASQPPTRSTRSSRPAPTTASSSPGSRSARSPGRPRPSRPPRCARYACRSSAAGRARSAPAPSSPSCPPSPRRSPGAPSRSTRAPSRWPTSSKPGPTLPPAASASSSSRSTAPGASGWR